MKAILKNLRFTPVILALTILATLVFPGKASTDPGTPTPIDLAVMQLVQVVALADIPKLEALVAQVEGVIEVLLVEEVVGVDVPGVDVDVRSKLKDHEISVDGDDNILASFQKGKFRGTINGAALKAAANGVELFHKPSDPFLFSQLSIQKRTIFPAGSFIRTAPSSIHISTWPPLIRTSRPTVLKVVDPPRSSNSTSAFSVVTLTSPNSLHLACPLQTSWCCSEPLTVWPDVCPRNVYASTVDHQTSPVRRYSLPCSSAWRICPST